MKTKLTYVILLILLQPCLLFSQNEVNCDSISKLIDKTGNFLNVDYDSVQFYFNKVENSNCEFSQKDSMDMFYIKGDITKAYGSPDSSIYYYQKSEEIANNTNDTLWQANNILSIGIALNALGYRDSCVQLMYKGIELTRDNPKFLYKKADFVLSLSTFYMQIGELKKSLELLQDIEVELENSIGVKPLKQAKIYNNFVAVMRKLKDREKQLFYAKKFLSTAEKTNLEFTCHAWENVATSFQDLKQNDSARFYMVKILEHNCPIDAVVEGYEGLAIIEFSDDNIALGTNYLNKAIKIAKDANLVQKSEQLKNVLGQTYYHTGKYDKAIDVFDSMKDTKNTTFQISRKYLIHSIIKNSGNPKHFDLSTTYFKRQDSLYNTRKVRNVQEFETKYSTQKKEQENQLLQKDKELKDETIAKQNIALIGGSIALGLISLLSFFLYRQREKQKQLNQKLEKQRDQIALLNRELNHRVKNNLAFMTSLLEMQGRRTSTKEAKMVLKESESRLKALALVHSNLFNNKENTEINLKNYLGEITDHLQNIFSPLDKDIEIETYFQDHNLDAEDAMRVGLIVNELVTNSVKHAFSKVEKPKITIETVTNNDGSISLRYRDNGPGISETLITKPDNKNESLGIKLISILERQLENKVKMIYQ